MKVILFSIFIFLAFSVNAADEIIEFEELAKGYYNQGKTVQSAEFYSKAGYAYWSKNNSNKAADCFEKAYSLFLEKNIINSALVVSNNLGIIYSENNKFNNAYKAFTNSLNLTRTTKNSIDIYNALLNVGTVSLELSNYTDAISKATEALALAQELDNMKYLRKCYSLLAESYEKTGESSNAYKYFELFSSIDQKIKAIEIEEYKNMTTEEISRAKENKRVAEIELKIKKGELKLTQDSLSVSERLSYERQMQIEIRNSELHQKEIQLRFERKIKRMLIIGLVLIFLFLSASIFLLLQKLKDNKTLKQQKDEITKQKNNLDIYNKKITDSIFYGLRIQNAMLPDVTKLEKVFDLFLIYKPKDIVSGDFFWYYERSFQSKIYRYIAVVDCTGHGVPGAFMSMIGNRLLSEIVRDKNQHSLSDILLEMNNHLRLELKQEKKIVDGMDIALCQILDLENGSYEIKYAGAKRAFYYYLNETNELLFIDGNNKAIGGVIDNSYTFKEHTLLLKKDDSIFLYSDGIIDQPNDNRDRYGTIKLMDVITKNIKKPMGEIKKKIEFSFETHKQSQEQRDDITLLGIKLK
jgi:serine phosphatase RsbU (regulator of sigma subunit)